MAQTVLNAMSLDDKYLAQRGEVVMSGIQALVRLPLDQHRRDRAAGLRTATFISGYRGSPLGGFDLALERAGTLLDEHHVRFMPGVNEDLAAAAVYGSQLAHTYPGARYDGVVGMWYGKGPGVDRTGDAFRHANVAGVGPNGGVLAIAGDDPAAKSSTVASASEFALLDAQMPILYPGTVAEVLRFGLLGFALSRFCGSWVGLKIVTNVADGFSTVALADPPPLILPSIVIDGHPWRPVQNAKLLAPWSLEQEREIHERRDLAARQFIAANDVNRIVIDPPDAWIGIVSAGKTFRDVLDALDALGLDESAARALGIRVLQLGAIHPLDPAIVGRFATGLDEIVVIEEKRSFIELFLRDALYGRAGAPRIVGKRDETDRLLVPGHGELDADRIRLILRARLTARVDPARLAPEPAAPGQRRLIPLTSAETRTPYFCSGCPHNRSTVVPDGSIANGAVGCSTMAMWMDRRTDNILQMGGEGVHWVGAAPFTETPHLFQNIGDGTFLHSGSLAIRQAIAAGANMTYKLLYNGAVAMTGGQQHDADLPLGSIVRLLVAEGAAHVLVVSDDPDTRRRELPDDIECWHRDRVIEAQEVLRAVPGVTVMVYDQACAADLRRKRKRGLVETPKHRIVINEAVCEGCGDCGAKSNCLSVQPIDTILGRKTQIHQASCNLDESCTTGNCPAFVKVFPSSTAAAVRSTFRVGRAWLGRERRDGALRSGVRGVGRPLDRLALDVLPEPTMVGGGSVDVLMTGVGGTGVVTVNQILGVAARLAGKYSTALDQTGLAQKGGSVVSHFRLAPEPIIGGNLVGQGRADVLLAFDAITAAQEVNLARCDAARTRAVVNTALAATGSQVRDVDAAAPSAGILEERLAAVTRPDGVLRFDADALGEELFGDHLPSNVIVLGAAYQRGLLPLPASAIERAIEMNGASVDTNLAAFRVGRATVADPAGVAVTVALTGGPVNPDRAGEALASLPSGLRAQIDVSIPAAAGELVAVCTANLIGFQSARFAEDYLAEVVDVARRERQGSHKLTATVARELHHLLAVKDEYEVARLHRAVAFNESLRGEFGAGTKATFLLQPPLLTRFGLQRKIGLRRSACVSFLVLAAAKRLRGTPLDPFGYAAHRRMERGLADEYRAQIRRALALLDESACAASVLAAPAAGEDGGVSVAPVAERNGAMPERAVKPVHESTDAPSPRYDEVVSALGLASRVRGFEAVKERNVEAWRSESAVAFARLEQPILARA